MYETRAHANELSFYGTSRRRRKQRVPKCEGKKTGKIGKYNKIGLYKALCANGCRLTNEKYFDFSLLFS